MPKYVNMRRLHTLGRDEESYGCGCVGGLSTVKEGGRDDEGKNAKANRQNYRG